MLPDKYVGLALAIVSTMAIGTSFVITKKGLMHASDRHGFEGDGFAYLRSPIWWAGIVTMVIGEVANFAAYAFAPAILVTPLGALSVLIGAVLGSYFLKEDLGTLGKLGCAMSLIGSVIIVLHAPPDKEITTVDEILQYAIHPGRFLYHTLMSCKLLTRFHRISVLLYRRCRLLNCHDIPHCTKIREEEPSHLYLYLLDCRFRVGHVRQSLWNCAKTDVEQQQPIHTPIYLCVCDCNRRLHFNTDELFQ